MKSAVWTRIHEVEVRQESEPTLRGPNEAIVKVLGCGVCGTDVHIFSGEAPLASPPVVLGHEIAGEIVETGAGVKDLKPGDFVCVDPLIGCGFCSHCQDGEPNLCPNPTIIGYAWNGGFEQYMRAPRTHLYPLDREKAGVKGGILVETLACVLNGYDRLNLRAGSNVLILGAGCVALLWTQLMRRSPTTRIFQTELVHSRREAAGKLGADVVVDPARDDLEAIVRGQSPGGVDCIIDGTGSADAIAHALPLLAKGGTLMIFGVCPANERLTVSPFEMFNNQWSIIASKMPPLRMTRSAKIIEAGIIDSETLVSRVLPLEDIKRGFGWFNDAKGEAIKMMIDPWL